MYEVVQMKDSPHISAKYHWGCYLCKDEVFVKYAQDISENLWTNTGQKIIAMDQREKLLTDFYLRIK